MKVFLSLYLLLAMVVGAQELYPDAKYDGLVPVPQEVLGYRLGERFTRHHRLLDYYRELARRSDKIKIVEYGRTVEDRPLVLLFISSPRNLLRLEEIRRANLLLSDPRKLAEEQMKKLVEELPGTVWLSYGVHGDEASSSEAAVQLVYHLLADSSQQTAKILDELVVIVDPLANPDGRERYVAFYEQASGKYPRSDLNAYEHQPPWPAGRYNHYLFDINRDWAWQTQQETRARVKAYLDWQPQVHVDYHEMSPERSYFFPPAAKPINHNLPKLTVDWLAIYGRGNAAVFDHFGIPYYTGEDYDLQYPGYGDSWPALQGAVGMTYEKAGGGKAGIILDLEGRQRSLSLRERIREHFLSGIATLKTAVETRRDRLEDYYKFRKQAVDSGRACYFFLAGRDPARTAAMVALLMAQGVEVHRATQGFRLKGVRSYYDDAATERDFPQGTYIVKLAQPAGLLAKALLEKEAPVKELFFYDVTAWTLPLAYGIEGYWVDYLPQVASELLTEAPVVKGKIEGEGNYYIFTSETIGALRTLSKLLVESYETYVSLRAFRIAGRNFAPGTIVVRAQASERLSELAVAHGHDIWVVPSAKAEEGVDLGSGRLLALKVPKILVVMGAGVSPSDYGAIWFEFDEIYNIQFTPVTIKQLASIDLWRYNVIIFPDDQERAYSSLDKTVVERLKEWVRAGNVFIGIKGGAIFATAKESGLAASITYKYISKREEEARIEREKAKEASESKQKVDQENGKQVEVIPYIEREMRKMTDSIPGAIFRLKIDNTHPLGFGYGQEVSVLNNNSPILSLTAKGENVVWYPKEVNRLAGFVSAENEQKLQHTAYLLRERVGKGSVILFADTPNFRAFWQETSRLLLNSVFFGHLSDPNLE